MIRFALPSIFSNRCTAWSLALCALLLLAEPAYAQDDEDALPPNSIYIELTPPMVANYGSEGRLRYVRVGVSIRAQESVEDAIRRHLPWIRHELLMLVSAQTDEAIGSTTGRESLRDEALQRVRQVLREEEDVEGVEDVLFTSFVVQR
jgi:flagellar FliL protein